MSTFIFANNVNTTLAASASSSATTLTLASSVNLPALTAGEILSLTLNDAATGSVYEVVYVTNISGATLTVNRGQEGTGAQNWSVGDFAFCGISSGPAEAFAQALQVQSAQFITATDTGGANAYAIALSPAPAALTPGMIVNVDNIVATNTGASTLNVNGLVALPIQLPGGAALAGGALVATYGAVLRLNHAATAWVLLNSTGQAAVAIPAGTIASFGGTTAPSGWLACPTAVTNVSRTTYAALFAAIGTAWGAGDGSTTFGIPYFPTGYVPVAGTPGSSTVGQVISHEHNELASGTGAATGSGTGGGGSFIGSSNVAGVTGYTGGSANLAAGMGVLICVKY